MKAKLLLVCVCAMFIPQLTAQVEKPKIASVDVVYKTGDVMHFQVNERRAGDVVLINLSDDKGNPLSTQKCTVYRYENGNEVDFTVPDLPEGYYKISARVKGVATRFKLVK